MPTKQTKTKPCSTATQLNRWVDEAGDDMTNERAATYMADLLGENISRETVRRILTSPDARKLKTTHVMALTIVLGHSVEDLPDDTRQRAVTTRDMLIRNLRCSTGSLVEA